MKILKLFTSAMLLASIVLLDSCKKEPELTDPIFSIEQISDDPIIVKATIQNDGGHSLSGAGFCWSATERNPEVGKSDDKKDLSASGKTFEYEFPCFNAGDRFHVRGYLKTADGLVFYSNTSIQIVQVTKMEFEGEKEFNISSEGQLLEIPFKTNSEYQILIPDEVDWIRVADARAMVSEKVQLIVAPNTEYDGREAEIQINSKDNSLSESFKIIQAQKDILAVNLNKFTKDYAASTLTFLVAHNVEYDIAISEAWITQNSTRGLEEDELSFALAENKTGKDRSGTITLTSKDKKLEQVIEVAQVNKYLNIPDPIFMEYLVWKWDKDGDGGISIEEAQRIEYVDIQMSTLASLEGIEHMPNVEKLYLAHNKLTYLDLSHNTKLKELYCNDNPLTELNIKGCVALELLKAYETKLQELVTENNPALTEMYVHTNELTHLDLSGTTNLKELQCYNNKLTALDLSKNKMLGRLSCEINKIAKLDLANNTMLFYIDTGKNQLTELDVSMLSELESLDAYDNKLTQIDVTHNKKLDYLYISHNQLETLDISQNKLMRYLEIRWNDLKEVYVWKGFDPSKFTCLTDDGVKFVEK